MIDKFTLSGGYWRRKIAWFKTFQILWSLLCSQQNSYQFWGSEIIPGCITSCQNFANLVKISLFHSWHVILFWGEKKFPNVGIVECFWMFRILVSLLLNINWFVIPLTQVTCNFYWTIFELPFQISLQTKKWLLRRNLNLYHISFNESCFTFGLIWIKYYKVLHWLFSHS